MPDASKIVVKETKDCIKDNPILADEVIRGCKYILARDPYYGEQLFPSSTLYFFHTTAYPPRVPSYRILYRYDLNKPDLVELIAIEEIPIKKSHAL
jgi:hypothetical protein